MLYVDECFEEMVEIAYDGWFWRRWLVELSQSR